MAMATAMAIMGGISAGIVAIIMAGATTATAIAIDAGDRRARMNAGGGVPPTLPSNSVWLVCSPAPACRLNDSMSEMRTKVDSWRARLLRGVGVLISAHVDGADHGSALQLRWLPALPARPSGSSKEQTSPICLLSNPRNLSFLSTCRRLRRLV